VAAVTILAEFRWGADGAPAGNLIGTHGALPSGTRTG
jgi:hypothetical protein